MSRVIQRALPLVAASVVALAGCTSGNSAIEPPIKSGNPGTNGVLQFAVGTANIADMNGAQHTGLNVVTTFRQQGGVSAALVSQPVITGPAGFVNVGGTAGGANTAGSDAGTANISGYIKGLAKATDTLGSSVGVFRSGLQPGNADTSGSANTGLLGDPVNCNDADFASCASSDGAGAAYTGLTFGGGAPLFPNVNNGLGQYVQFNPGFTTFENVTLASGSYTETVNLPNAVGVAATYTKTATLNAAQVLPPMPNPHFVPDGNGGGTITLTVPAGVTESWVWLEDTAPGSCYTHGAGTAASFTFRVTGTGAQTITVPDNLGGAPAGSPATPTICTGDNYILAAVGFDYAAFPIADPNNTSETPALPAQADVTTSYAEGGTYAAGTPSSTATTLSVRRHR